MSRIYVYYNNENITYVTSFCLMNDPSARSVFRATKENMYFQSWKKHDDTERKIAVKLWLIIQFTF